MQPVTNKLKSYGKVADSCHLTFFSKTGKIFESVFRRKSIIQDFPAKNFSWIIVPLSYKCKKLFFDFGYGYFLHPALQGMVMEAPGMIVMLFGLLSRTRLIFSAMIASENEINKIKF